MRAFAGGLFGACLVAFVFGWCIGIYYADRHDKQQAEACAERGGHIVRGGHMNRSRYCRLPSGELTR